jgi:tetratricopeptide (TPR) repeat protein
MDTWEEFIKGPSERAIGLFRSEYDRTGNPGTLMNLGLAYLDLGRTKDARGTFEHLLQTGHYEPTEKTLILVGVNEWLLGDYSNALGAWKRSLSTHYTDEAGGVSGASALWYGALRSGDVTLAKTAERRLRKLWSRGKVLALDKTWPGSIAIAGYILGDVLGEALLECKCDHAILEIRRLCRVNFWVGVKSLDMNSAATWFHKALACDKRAILEYEYFLARWEYNRLTSEVVSSPE